jgi:hypothetical protein
MHSATPLQIGRLRQQALAGVRISRSDRHEFDPAAFKGSRRKSVASFRAGRKRNRSYLGELAAG